MPKIKAVIFDFDGTLFDLAVDWEMVRQAIGSTDGTLYRFLDSLSGDAKKQAIRKIKAFEWRGALNGTPLAGAKDTLRDLKKREIKVAVVSRNSKEAIIEAFKRNGFPEPDIILGLEEIKRHKPETEAVETVLARFKLTPADCVLVGDSANDMEMAKRAGIYRVLVRNPKFKHQAPADEVISGPSDLTF